MRPRVTALALLLAASAPAAAKVSLEDAARLRTVLTPVGAERPGNVEGTIQTWTGGLRSPPRCYRAIGDRLCDPYPDDKPLFSITAENVDRFRDRLSAGQAAMLRRHPASYRLNIYRTRRTAGFPDLVEDATFKNALNAELVRGGDSIARATMGIPFPIPDAGVEAVWNHKLRYRGTGLRRWNEQAVVNEHGEYTLAKAREDLRFAHSVRGATTESLGNVFAYFLRVTMQPARLAGQVTLVHDTLDAAKEPRRSWHYNPGQKRVRRSAQVGYDNPAPGSDGLATYDQADMFSGPTDRYVWRIVGKRDVFIAYNAYRIHSDRHRVRDIVRRGHINQDLARYELHRVWVVEGVLKRNTTHVYARRVLYLDEDSWQIVLADLYDRRGNLWRWQEAHVIQAYEQPFPLTALEAVYDLTSNRYLIQAMNNEDDETVARDFDASYFDPSSVSRLALQ